MRKLIVLLIILIQTTYVFSQNTLTITREQLIITNKIFAEHEKLKLQVPLLEAKITNLNTLIYRQDSVYNYKLLACDKQIKNQYDQIQDLNKSIAVKNKVIRYGTFGSIVLVIICLLK